MAMFALDDFNRDRPDAPVFSLGAGGHPDVDSLISPFLVHPIFNREDLVTEIIGNANFSAEWQTITGYRANMHFRPRGGRERIIVRLIAGGGIGTGPDRQTLTSGSFGNAR